jgi:hypothetical protein
MLSALWRLTKWRIIMRRALKRDYEQLLRNIGAIPDDLRKEIDGAHNAFDRFNAVAWYAAENGLIHEGFRSWDFFCNMQGESFSVAHIAAHRSNLPPSFKLWDLEDSEGTTVADICAMKGTLPADFSEWSIVSECTGIPVAHTAAKYNTLPSNFDQWGVADADGLTTLHVAASSGTIPEDLDIWEASSMFDSVGQDRMAAVELAIRLGTIPPTESNFNRLRELDRLTDFVDRLESKAFWASLSLRDADGERAERAVVKWLALLYAHRNTIGTGIISKLKVIFAEEYAALSVSSYMSGGEDKEANLLL